MTTAGVVTTTDTWLVHRLCGAFVTDASTASRSLLTSLDSTEWDDELIGLFGLTGEALPEIVGCDQIVGSTDAFGPTMPVAGLIVDQQAALLAESCLTPGDAKTHIRHRGVSAGAAGRQRRPVHVGPDHLGGVAVARAHVLLRRRPGLHRGLRGAVGGRPWPGAVGE